MSLISSNRVELLNSLIKLENDLYHLSKVAYHIHADVKAYFPTLSPLIDSELYRAYRLLDYAHDQIYNHNIKLKLTYEE